MAEQKRGAGQEGRHRQPGFRETHQEEDGVDPGAVLLNQVEQVRVDVQDEIDRIRSMSDFVIAGYVVFRARVSPLHRLVFTRAK